MDITKVCRSCLTNEGDMVSLYEAYSTDMCFGEVLMSITTLSSLEFYDDNEHLPKQICHNCIKNLKHSYKFVLLCRDSEEKLQNCLEEAVTITETNVSNDSFLIISNNISDCEIEEANETNPPQLMLIETCITSDDNESIDSMIEEHKLPTETEESNQSTDISNNNNKQNEIDHKNAGSTESSALKMQTGQNNSFLNVFIKSVDESKQIARKKRNARLNIKPEHKSNSFTLEENKLEGTATSDTLKRSYLCTVCGSSFTSNSYLTCHMRSHTGERPYSCTECSSSFTNSSYLIRHMRIHTGEKQYPCSECNSSFSEKQSLVVHMRSHTGEKPYSCSICNKAFSRTSHVIRHMRLHTGEKPYTCTVCGSSFVENATLIAHSRIHSGEKPYSCIVCDKSFNVKMALTRHMLRHNGQKPYSCSMCERSFIQKSSLNLHMQKMHENNTFE